MIRMLLLPVSAAAIPCLFRAVPGLLLRVYLQWQYIVNPPFAHVSRGGWSSYLDIEGPLAARAVAL